jgi:hypothetical protein
MDEPSGRPRLVKRPCGTVILQMNDQRTCGACRRQQPDQAANKSGRIGNGRLAVEQAALRIDKH